MSLNYCYCWKIEPLASDTLYYTTTNNSVDFLGNSYTPTGAVPHTIIIKSIGLSVDNLELVGAFSEDISFQGVRNRKFVGATVTGYRVNVEDTADYTLEFKGKVGEFVYDDFQFKAEVRSLTFAINRAKGRVYSRNCPYVLGGNLCGVDTTLHEETATVTEVSGLTLTLDSSYTEDNYSFGKVTSSEGVSQDIRKSLGSTITLWDSPVFEVGDVVTLTRGCDKTRQTCKSVFNNVINYGGFDLIPSESVITDVAFASKDIYDGSSYFEQLD